MWIGSTRRCATCDTCDPCDPVPSLVLSSVITQKRGDITLATPSLKILLARGRGDRNPEASRSGREPLSALVDIRPCDPTRI